jgi:aerobic-type carbon monoxide dehydrogenase small subunit (CoxS/CutS family)
MPFEIQLHVNGQARVLRVADGEMLCDVLRDRLDLTGTKIGCKEGVCGSCDVLLDGEVIRSCLVLAAQADDAAVTTVEGLGSGSGLGALQEAFVAHGAVQCGFCTSGMLIAATAALAKDPALAATDLEEALAGNLCRCTGYSKVVDAVAATARQNAS